jgi:phage shock protein C
MSDRLYRSRDDRMLAGVAGGLAEMWDADPALVRLIWALLVIFTGGIALLVYIVMAIVVPEEEDELLPPAPFAAPAPPVATDIAPTAATTPEASVSTGAIAVPATAPTQPAPVAPPPNYWVPSGPSRADARAARRAARRARRQGGDSAAPIIIGGFLVLLGGFFLAREWLPELDWDWFWPAMLIALGVLLLLIALGRRSDDQGDPS